jgi:hypothetical protein
MLVGNIGLLPLKSLSPIGRMTLSFGIKSISVEAVFSIFAYKFELTFCMENFVK